jgi:hypothetical protein
MGDDSAIRDRHENRDKPPKVKRMYEKDLLAIMAAIIFTRGGSSQDTGEAIKIARNILDQTKQ